MEDRRTANADDPTRNAEWPPASANSRFPFWDVIPLTLVLLTLLGSVAVPAHETWRILRLLRESTEVLAPARLLVEQLQTGMAQELTGLQAFAISDDHALLERQRATAAANDERLSALARLAPRLDPESARRIEAVRMSVAGWRLAGSALPRQGSPRRGFGVALRAGQSSYDASLTAIGTLSAGLAAAAAGRDREVAALEHFSIVSNGVLVLATLLAMSGVLILTLRQRRFSAMLRLRAAEEVALRQLARRLSAAETRGTALRCVVEDTLSITHAQGVYVEWMIPGRRVLQCLATAGRRTMMSCTRGAYDGSLTAVHTAAGGPIAVVELPVTDDSLGARLTDACGRCPGLVIPLLSADRTLGVIALLRQPAASPFGDAARRQLRLLSDLASEALRRVDGTTAERAALKQARRRARREAALRAAAEALAAAYTTEEVTQRIAHAALDAMPGHGAFVEQVTRRPPHGSAEVTVQAVAGLDVPMLGVALPLAGSYAEHAMAKGEPMLITDLACPAMAAPHSTLLPRAGSAIIVPLGTSTTPLGALFVVSATPGRFRAGDVTRAGIFGHLAALAYERVALLEQAHERQAILERVVTSRSRLIRGFSHDVKNAVGAADGFAELLSLGVYGELPVAPRASVDRLRRSLRAAIALVDDLHELGRAETGRIALSLAPVDPGELMYSVVEEYHAMAQRAGLSLSVTVDPDVSSIETDRARVRQIASNLLSNAIKYTPHGSVLVRVRHQRIRLMGQADDWTLLEFIDSGVGIPAGKEDYIFEEFSRLGNADAPGAGLGLAISRLLAHALGGEIVVESELGHGSTFTLRLPVRPPARSD